MRVSKNQIVQGITDYIQSGIIPKLSNAKAAQIIATVAVNAIKANNKIIDGIWGKEFVRQLLADDGNGTYDISGLMDSIKAAVNQHGYFPVVIPAIPFVSPQQITLTLDAEDVAEMQRRIEGTV